MKQFAAKDFAAFLNEYGAQSVEDAVLPMFNISEEGRFQEFAASALLLAKRAHHLSIDPDHVPRAKDTTLLRLPYEVMLFGYRSIVYTEGGKTREDIDVVLLAVERGEEECTILIVFLRNLHTGYAMGTGAIKLYWDGTLEVFTPVGVLCPTEKAKTDLNTIAGAATRILLDVLHLIHCANVELEHVQPSQLKQARAKKKGDMLEAYSVIKLPHTHYKREPHKGGTHASPIMHTRMGHYRKLRTGKRVYVRDCVVGNWLGGIKQSDYEV